MSDIRTVKYEEIYLEDAKLQMGETFVSHFEDLDNLPEEERQTVVEQVAKMATAAEVYIFDREVGACHMNCQVYELGDGSQMGILLAAEKTESGVYSDIIWTNPAELMQNGFSYEEVRALGFAG